MITDDALKHVVSEALDSRAREAASLKEWKYRAVEKLGVDIHPIGWVNS